MNQPILVQKSVADIFPLGFLKRKSRVMKNLIKNIKYGVMNFWKYKSIIWNDRDWDYYFLLNLMEFKARNMSNEIRRYGDTVDSENKADELERFACLIKQLKEENFDFHSDIVHAEYGDLSYDLEKSLNFKISQEYMCDLKKAWEKDEEERKYVEDEMIELFRKYRNWWI